MEWLKTMSFEQLDAEYYSSNLEYEHQQLKGDKKAMAEWMEVLNAITAEMSTREENNWKEVEREFDD